MEKLIKKAYGKINLGLDVLRRRPDGYHEVKMIMQMVDIYDTLTFEKRADDQIVLSANREDIPCDESNLIYKAAKLLFDYKQVSYGVNIHLEKRIPVAAGMAGGSTDAAAAFTGVNELFELGVSQKELMELAVKVGADVPYCILGGCALSEGIGEVLTPLPNPPYCEMVIAKPDINVSTKYVYENLNLPELKKHPDIDGIKAAIEAGNLEGVIERLENVLESVTVKKYGIIQDIKDEMISLGASNAIMSGSGPTVFGFFDTREEAEAAKEKILDKELAKEVFVAHFMEAIEE